MFAIQCESLLLYDLKQRIIVSISVVGGREMAISYNKLWKLLVDRKMSKADLRKAAGIAAKYHDPLEAAMRKLHLRCSIRSVLMLGADIGDIMEFLPEEKAER